MSNLKIHAGDFPKCKASMSVSSGYFAISIPWQPGDGWGIGKTHRFQKEQITEISLASEENIKRIGGTVGWGLAGAVLLGPVGLLAGLILGGKGKEVTFIALFADGRKLLATTDAKTYTKLQSIVF